MNYLITTSSNNTTYSHLVKGLSSNDIQIIFNPLSIVQHEQDTEDKDFDLVADCIFEEKKFQIISNYKKVTDFFDYIKSSWSSISLTSINSLSKPLDEDKMKELIKQLEDKLQQKHETITPSIKKLVDETTKDVEEFINRYTWYAEQKELDTVQSRGQDIQLFADQGNLEELKKRMSLLIDKMEVLESSYIKKINLEEDKPLDQFNHELNFIINQNRLNRYQWLNQLSGWSKLDYFMFKLKSSFAALFHSIDDELKSFQENFTLLGQWISSIFIWWVVVASIMLFFYKLNNKTFSYDAIFLWISWITLLFCNWTLSKKRYVSIILIIIFLFLGYFANNILKINFGL